MFNKPAAFAVPLRRSIGAASVIMGFVGRRWSFSDGSNR
jgi:hypothetical protein